MRPDRERWSATIEDSVDSEPVTTIGDLIVAVRTPRSHDFVSVDVGIAQDTHAESHPTTGPPIVVASRPQPWFTPLWAGEVHVGEDHAVDFRIRSRTYHLTLRRLREAGDGYPWVTCDFVLERA